VNAYRVVRAVAERRAESTITDHATRTIHWLALCGQWPYTVRAMLRYFGDLREGGDAILERENDDPLGYLLETVAPHLDEEARKRHDDDIDRLAALLKISDKSFTWDELETIERYTINFNPAVDSELDEALATLDPAEEIIKGRSRPRKSTTQMGTRTSGHGASARR